MIKIKPQHEDAIYKAKEFINELSKVQDSYLACLAKELNVTEKGEEWLFDYVFNGGDTYEDFQHYCDTYGIKDDIYESKSFTPITDICKRKIEGYADEWVPRYVSEELERRLHEANQQMLKQDDPLSYLPRYKC